MLGAFTPYVSEKNNVNFVKEFTSATDEEGGKKWGQGHPSLWGRNIYCSCWLWATVLQVHAYAGGSGVCGGYRSSCKAVPFIQKGEQSTINCPTAIHWLNIHVSIAIISLRVSQNFSLVKLSKRFVTKTEFSCGLYFFTLVLLQALLSEFRRSSEVYFLPLSKLLLPLTKKRVWRWGVGKGRLSARF